MPVLAVLDISIQDTWPLLLLPVAFGLAFIGYRRTTPPLSGGRRAALVALRTIAYALLLFVLASPVLNRVRGESMRARIAVLVDESASMSTVDGAPGHGGRPRLERARDALRTLQDELRGSGADLEVVPFATGVEPALEPRVYLQGERRAQGAGTDLLGAVRATTERLAAQNLQAVVLLSDGRPTRGALDPAGPSNLPLFTVGFGDTLAPSDVGIERCDYNQVAYLESESSIEVRVENSGLRGRSTSLRLLQGDRELFRRRLTFDQEHGRTTVQIPIKLDKPGRQRFRLALDPLPGEATEKNNSREISIEVLKNRIRVLLLAARPDWDAGFLARLLRDDPNVRLQLVHLNSEGAWVQSEDASPFSLPRGAKAGEDYDLYVVATPGGQPQPGLWKDVLSAVERGKGLLLLAGRQSAMTTGDAFAALAAALPIERGRVRAPKFEPVELRLTPQGRHHPATAPFADLADPRGEIDALPPLLGLHVEVSAKPDAMVLLATASDPPSPVLVVGRYGQGQTAAFTGFPVWRWGFTDREPLRRATTQFVANLVRWLTQPHDVRQVQITSAKTVYEGGENAEFVVHVLDAQYAPLDDAEVRVEVQRLGGAGGAAGTLLLSRRQGHDGEYTGTLSGLGPGEYEARAVAVRQGAEVGRDASRFTVDAYSAEYANLSQDVDFLRELAARSGGRYAAPEQVAELARALPHQAHRTLLRSEIEIWNTTPLFLLFVVALGAEWLLRKRYGLL